MTLIAKGQVKKAYTCDLLYGSQLTTLVEAARVPDWNIGVVQQHMKE